MGGLDLHGVTLSGMKGSEAGPFYAFGTNTLSLGRIVLRAFLFCVPESGHVQDTFFEFDSCAHPPTTADVLLE